MLHRPPPNHHGQLFSVKAFWYWSFTNFAFDQFYTFSFCVDKNLILNFHKLDSSDCIKASQSTRYSNAPNCDDYQRFKYVKMNQNHSKKMEEP